jgi:hypothetical protein
LEKDIRKYYLEGKEKDPKPQAKVNVKNKYYLR